MASQRRVSPVATAVIGVILGFVFASLLHAYPKDVVTRHRYCRDCGIWEETYDEGVILGGVHSSKRSMTGPVHDLLSDALGDHEHRYTDWATIVPTYGVEAEHPEIADTVLQLRNLQEHARGISLLEQAMHNDPTRATALLQRILEPGAPFPTQAIQALDRHPSWPERWAAVDAALKASRTQN